MSQCAGCMEHVKVISAFSPLFHNAAGYQAAYTEHRWGRTGSKCTKESINGCSFASSVIFHICSLRGCTLDVPGTIYTYVYDHELMLPYWNRQFTVQGKSNWLILDTL